jgi:hypothetical protein
MLPERDDANTGPLRPPPDQVELTIADDRGRHVLHVAGEIDLATASRRCATPSISC